MLARLRRPENNTGRLLVATGLAGSRNWYLPSWLGWLPRLEHEPPPATA